MSDNAKKNHDDKLKLKVALAMIKADKSVDIICREFNISPYAGAVSNLTV